MCSFSDEVSVRVDACSSKLKDSGVKPEQAADGFHASLSRRSHSMGVAATKACSTIARECEVHSQDVVFYTTT